METEATSIVVDLSLYTRDAIRKAAYKFTESWYVELASTSEQVVTVSFTAKKKEMAADQVRKEFLNELLDQTLREQIAAETLAVRNLIMAHALGKLDLIESTNAISSTEK